MEPYSVFNIAQALGVFIFEIIESAVDTREKYIVYTSFIGIIGLYSCGITYFFEFRETKSIDTSVTHQANPTLEGENQNNRRAN